MARNLLESLAETHAQQGKGSKCVGQADWEDSSSEFFSGLLTRFK